MKEKTPYQMAQQLTEAAKSFETSRIELIKKSNKLAWKISGMSLLLTVITLCSLFFILPLKTVEPYVISVDKQTGQTEILYALKEKSISKEEQLDRYWLKNYVTFRESYDWYTVQTNYDVTMMFNTGKEQKALMEFFNGPNAPYKVFKNDYRVDIKVTAISFIGQLAQVRFEKRLKDLKEPQKEAVTQKFIATISYEYLNTKVPQEERLVNPLGFKVNSYILDTEQ